MRAMKPRPPATTWSTSAPACADASSIEPCARFETGAHLAGGGEREPRLPHAAGTGQCDEPAAFERGAATCCDLLLTADDG